MTLRSSTLDDHFGNAIPPLRVRWCEGSVVVSQILEPEATRNTKLEIGDIIMCVDGEDIQERMARAWRYVAASTKQAWRRNAVARALRGDDQTNTILTIRDAGGIEKDVVLPRRKAMQWRGSGSQRYDEVLKWISAGIGYADLDRLKPSQVDEMFEMFAKAKAIVFDVRGHPNMRLYKIAARLTHDSSVHAALIERSLVSGPLKGDGGTWLPLKETFWQDLPSPVGPRFEGLAVLLMDETAQSHAEYTGLFLKAANGTAFVASTTAGANGDITGFVLPGDMTATFTGLAVQHPDGRQLQRVGLLLDVPVSPTINGLQEGRDEVLEAPIAYLENKLSACD